MKNNQSLSVRFTKLLDYAIQRRTYLLESGFNKKTEHRMSELLAKLTPYKGYRFTEEGAVKFIREHYAEIRQLIPEREVNKVTQLENLWLAAKNPFIINQQNLPQCQQLSIF